MIFQSKVKEAIKECFLVVYIQIGIIYIAFVHLLLRVFLLSHESSETFQYIYLLLHMLAYNYI